MKKLNILKKMQEIMLIILKNIRNSLLILILLTVNAEAKNSKDVSNIKVQKKSISHKQKYSLQLVDSKDGHPVRSGNKSWRFEVREGDCGGDKKHSDCKSNRQRTELQTKEHQKINKEYWYSASIYLPNNYVSAAPVKTVFTQIYERGWKPILMITDRENKWLEVGRMWSGEYVEMKKGIKINDMKGKWTDILINVRYSRKEDGFMKVWINNKLILESLNIKTFTPYTNKGAGLDWGIYQTGVSYWKNKNGDKPYPSMVVYFDEVNQGNSKEKVTKNLGN
ncbi:polysaccharide lyase [Candidatus Pelagibacter bacterium]|nr:polysaccharide lyase [Candidatus Pelagibacter bacterium]MDA8772383.1 polysaccharide lyase [Candidatus Pelagibacter bacterium]MDC0433607.1 polysaccharide lyase [Pelagibacteraceae bacterium]MDC0488879.1 polysaccharide lyase [Pelagibacteraceae bacterium]MDC1130744.1 heparin lyase I family protein [Pelagibacteraceae bacterium]